MDPPRRSQTQTTGSFAAAVDSEAGTVTYRGVWPNVDVRYTVKPWGVKEDVVVNGPTDTSSFVFDTTGAALAPAQGGLVPGELSVGGSKTFRVAAPSVADKTGTDITKTAAPALTVAERPVVDAAPAAADGDVPVQDDLEAAPSAPAAPAPGPAPVAGQSLTLAVDSGWLSGLEAGQFPVMLDPSIIVGADDWVSYGSQAGWSCGQTCGHRVGNAVANGDLYWRGMLHIPYENVIAEGRKIVSATLNLGRLSGTPNPNVISACWATAFSFAGACGNGWSGQSTIADNTTIDLTDLHRYLVDNSISGAWLGLVGNEQPGLFTFQELQANLTIVSSTPPPPPPNDGSTLPADGAVLASLTPTMALAAMTDGDHPNGFIYGWSIATGPDGLSGQVTSSGPVLASGSTASWTVPVGALRDGQTYYWRAYTYDGTTLTMAPWTRKFKVDMRLGSGGPSPTDAMGQVQTNLATGNVTAGFSTPSIPVVGGSMGVSLTYNSKAAGSSGLRGSYFNDNNNNRLFDDTLMFSRDDPQVFFDWGAGSPAPAIGVDNYLVRWDGWLTEPANGTYYLGTISDDGVRVWIDNTLVLDRWFDQGPAPAPDWSVPIGFSGTPRRIRVEYYENSAGAVMKLYQKSAADPNQIVVPAQYLSTDAPAVPAGWTFSGGEDDVAYVSATVSETSVILKAVDGSSWEYTRTAGAAPGFKPPTGIDDVMVTNPDGTITVYADDGRQYVFSTAGQLLFVRSSTDDLAPAAVERTWAPLANPGDPVRLKKLKDPVSGQEINLTYSGSGTCPTGPGYFTPPIGMLCQVAYWDGTSTGVFYDAYGRITRFENPGAAWGATLYDTNGRLSAMSTPLANDAFVAGVRPGDGSLATLIGYDGQGRATTVTAPAPTLGATAATKTYTYSSGATVIATSGIAPTSQVSFDANLRQLSATDATGKTATKTWDVADRPTTTVGPDGVKSSTVYDSHGWATDTYGPGPASAFTGQVGNSTVAHTTTAFDQNMAGLAAAWYDNGALSGTAKTHTLGTGTAGGEVYNDWASPPNGMPGAYSLRLTGDITLAAAGNYNFTTWSKSKARVYVDDNLISDSWTDPDSTWVLAAGGVFNNPTAGSVHRIRVDMANTVGQSGLQLHYLPPGGAWGTVPGDRAQAPLRAHHHHRRRSWRRAPQLDHHHQLHRRQQHRPPTRAGDCHHRRSGRVEPDHHHRL